MKTSIDTAEHDRPVPTAEGRHHTRRPGRRWGRRRERLVVVPPYGDVRA